MCYSSAWNIYSVVTIMSLSLSVLFWVLSFGWECVKRASHSNQPIQSSDKRINDATPAEYELRRNYTWTHFCCCCLKKRKKKKSISRENFCIFYSKLKQKVSLCLLFFVDFGRFISFVSKINFHSRQIPPFGQQIDVAQLVFYGVSSTSDDTVSFFLDSSFCSFFVVVVAVIRGIQLLVLFLFVRLLWFFDDIRFFFSFHCVFEFTSRLTR